MMSKEFLTYYKQMQKLRNDKKIKCSGLNDRKLLIQNGYFNLVNGYKSPFTSSVDVNGDHIYNSGTTIEHIYFVKEFDDNLRQLLFRHIIKIEEEVRTLSGYKFDEVNNKGAIDWFQIEAYDTARSTNLEVAEFISSLMRDMYNSKNTYLEDYRENHHAIPTWILTKNLRFSTFINMLYFSKTDVKKELCTLYGMINNQGYPEYKLLIGSLHYIRQIRNACAHNERVFDLASKWRISCSYLNILPTPYRRLRGAKKEIIDLLVYMRYYLDDDTYCSIIDEVSALLSGLKANIPTSAYNYVRGKMGIKDEADLLILRSTSKPIDYINFG